MITKSIGKRIVTLDMSLRNGNDYETCRSILEHAAQMEHWELEGFGATPFHQFAKIPWDRIDGLLGSFKDESAARLASAHGVAVVNTIAEEEGLPYTIVTSDDVAVGRVGAEHLLKRGFSTYAFLGDPNSQASALRQSGFEAAIKEAGRPVLVENIILKKHDWYLEWVKSLPTPIAVMGYIDGYVRPVINAALSLGLRVPEDVAVLGVNNNLWNSIMAKASLSSVQLDAASIGTLAARTLDRLMKGEPSPPPQWVPPIGVVTRQSTDVIVSDDPVVVQAVEYIRQNATAGIDVGDVLGVVDVSRSTLDKRMQRAIGQSAYALIIETRIDKVKEMIKTTNISLEEVSRLCGFQQQPRLNEAFKRLTGMTPTQFRQQHHPV